MENLTIALNCVAPIFIYILVGYLSKLAKIVPDEAYTHMNKLAYTVLISMQMFYSVYASDFSAGSVFRVVGYTAGASLAIFIVAGFIYSLITKDRRKRGAFWQITYRSNLAVIGLPIAQSLGGNEAAATMSIVVAITGTLYNILGVICLEICRDGKPTIKNVFRGFFTNPFIRAIIIGIPFAVCKIRFPECVDTAITTLGKSGTALALITLGASFEFRSLKSRLGELICMNIVRLLVVPAAAIAVAVLMGFRGTDLGVILISFAAPLAIASYPMARAYDSDYEITGQLVVTTSVLCCLTLFLWIFVLKELGLM